MQHCARAARLSGAAAPWRAVPRVPGCRFALPVHPSASFSASARSASTAERNRQYAIYATAAAIAVGGMSYAAVPLYKAFCQATGYGGTTQRVEVETFKTMKPVQGARQLTVHFNADTSANMPWTFKPQQRSVKVVPGETALAFYTAHNPTDKPITGVSTYNITPMRAGLYFSKIQCFCFEEQRLRPHEEIDMPVFFYVDPAFLDDPAMANVKSLTLSYTFFRTGEQEVQDIAAELLQKDVTHDSMTEKVKAWTAEVAAKTGVPAPGPAAAAALADAAGAAAVTSTVAAVAAPSAVV